MALKDIEKLREKVEKDPNSKLFVPLAEEYRKEGMLDEAISVLLAGIEKQPGYTSARVSLGKIYAEKGMITEAKSEFENVIKVIPDNLYAHKKLAEIYRDSGNREAAIKSFRTVLKLNAMDEDASMNLNELEGESTAENPPQAVPAPAALPEAPPIAAEEVMDDAELHEALAPVSEAAPAHSEEELNSFKEAIFGGGAAEEEKISEESVQVEEETVETAVTGEQQGGENIASSDLTEEASAEISFEEPAEEAVAELSLDEASEEEELSFEEPAEEGSEEISFGDIREALSQAEPAIPEIPETVFTEMISEETSADRETFPAVEKASPDTGATLEDAERLISEGNYAGALNIYRGMLSLDPQDRKTLQRVEELRALLKMMGKDKEVLIEKMNSFLDGIKKRRDEFLRSS